MKTRLITAALPYTNNVPHLGNIVGSHLPADIFARYCRLAGYDTLLIGGTDEHGTATEISAKKHGLTPKELSDFFYKIHKQIYEWFNISYDNFSRTSKKIHHEITQDIFLKLLKNKYIAERQIEVPYCVGCDLYLSDRFVIGLCPKCGYEKARGDQCEKCGELLDPKDLGNIQCAVCGKSDIKFVKKEHLFLELDKLEPKLKKWVEDNKTWRSNVKSIALSWIKEGLKPRDITRELNWGVDVPIKGYENSVLYCWFDAPIGYISSTKEKSKNWDKKYWKNKNCEIFNFIGKDNIPFHTLFFPAILIGDGRFTLPHNVVGLQYLNFERKKFSKSSGHGVFCENLLETDLSSDYWRFYLSFVIPESKDTEFLWDDFVNRINSELIGNYSNFVNRTLKFIENNFNGKIPKGKTDDDLKKQVEKKVDKILDCFEKVELRLALLNILRLSDFGNKYFEEQKPWKDKNPDVLFFCANLVKILSLLIQPFIPLASVKVLKTLGVSEKDFKGLLDFNLKDKKIGKVEILFEKIDDKKLEELKVKTSKVTEYFEKSDFEKLDIVVGKIKDVKKHVNADKLYVLDVDIGDEIRTIVSGLRDYYDISELKGKKIAFLKNLEPATFRGVKSNGMLLAACSEDESVVVLLEPTGKVGSKIYVNKDYNKADEKVSYSEFQKVKMITSNKQVEVDGNALKTDKGLIKADVSDGLAVS